jgi:hypothetical protein
LYTQASVIGAANSITIFLIVPIDALMLYRDASANGEVWYHKKVDTKASSTVEGASAALD